MENYTHPDIIKMERFGELTPQKKPRSIGCCLFCGSEIFSDGLEYVRSFDGVFCKTDCCHAYYEIEVIS